MGLQNREALVELIHRSIVKAASAVLISSPLVVVRAPECPDRKPS
jgi:hypothetical protein